MIYIPLFFITLITSILCIYFFHYFNLNIKSSHSIHNGDIPRVGGLIIFISLLFITIINFFDSDKLYFYILIIICPTFFVAFIEDITQRVKPSIRLIAIIISTFIYIYFFGTINSVDIPLFNFIFSNKLFLYLLTIIAFASLTNALNLIDGLNGLALLNFIVISFTIFFICLNDQLLLNFNTLPIILITSVILFFNFPSAKLFLGDSGAYLLGLLLSIQITNFFNIFSFYPSWLAILFLIYPITETIFTFVRRIFKKTRISKADNDHMHSYVYKIIKLTTCKKLIGNKNSLSTLVLFPIILYGPVFGYFFRFNLKFIVLSIILFIFLYVTFYIYLFKHLNNLKK